MGKAAVNRYKIIQFSLASFIGFFIQGRDIRYTVKEGLPEDVEIVEIRPIYEKGIVELLVESESFEERPEGEYPYLDIVVSDLK